MTNSKVRNSDSAYSRYTTFSIVFYSITLIQTGQTNTHTYTQTNINQVLIIKSTDSA